MSESYLRDPLDVVRTDDFIRFTRTSAFSVYTFLRSYIIRKRPRGRGFGKMLYDDFWASGYLVSRWSQKEAAKRLGTKQGNVSRDIKKLKDK